MSEAGAPAMRGLGPWRMPAPPPDFRPFPAHAVEVSVGARFREVAGRRGDAIAVRSPAATWTYAELLVEVHRMAAGIQRLLPPALAQPVAVVADHDGPLVAALLAIASAGQVIVVVDPSAPTEQQAEVLAESRPRLLLFDAAHADLAESLRDHLPPAANVVALGELRGSFVPPEGLHWSTPLMLAFTSGTTGSTKAASIGHGVLMNLVRGATDALGITAEDRMPMLFPTSLAVAAYPMFLPLLNGGTLATLDVRSVGLAPVGDFLAEERITVAYIAPVVLRFLADALAGRTFPDLRMLALGGELVDLDALRLAVELLAPAHVAVGYGTTETGVVSLAVYEAAEISGPHLEGGPIAAGYAVPDARIVVTDEGGQPLPPGGSGEINVVSRYLFDGYWGHPELTRQVLRPDPTGTSDDLAYRTGDLGHLDEGGALVVLGRSDAKVKVRGRWVVLGDVEADLHESDAVADAAVSARTVDGVAELVAYVVPAGDDLSVTALRRSLLERREAYRVPSRWIVLDELPRLPNGKTDRRALPDPDLADDAAVATEDVVVGRDEHERLRAEVRRLWEELLPVGAVGYDEDFSDLGGDSLLAAQMLVMLEHRTGVTIPMGELVHARTVREVAEVAFRIRSRTDGVTTVSRVQHGDESTRPRLWFVHDLQGSAYRVRHVAAALGPDQPVWSFESPLLAGSPNRCSSLDTFAATYVTDLLEAQPDGPYWLAGYSFGGICAYEMARQLRRDGHEVAFLGVVDVGPGYRGPGWPDHRAPDRPWFGVKKPPPPGLGIGDQIRYYRHMLEESPAGTLRHVMVRSGLARLIDPLRFRADLRATGRVRPEWRLWYAWDQHWRLAAHAWDRTNRYAGRVDLFWASKTPSADASLGWDDLVGELRIHRFEGDHDGILEPRGADHLARALRAALDATRDE